MHSQNDQLFLNMVSESTALQLSRGHRRHRVSGKNAISVSKAREFRPHFKAEHEGFSRQRDKARAAWLLVSVGAFKFVLLSTLW